MARTNFWFEHALDAYLVALAEGLGEHAAKAAYAAALARANDAPRRLLKQTDLRSKGITYSRQHLTKLLKKGAFPRPLQLPVK
jgi:hypothetical protein